jgi:hypothetical protein
MQDRPAQVGAILTVPLCDAPIGGIGETAEKLDLRTPIQPAFRIKGIAQPLEKP